MMLRSSLGLAGLALVLSATACSLLAPPDASPQQGGANVNDRTFGGEPGQELLTGAMSVSPRGGFALLQRNTLSVVFDVAAKKYVELPFRVVRVAWDPSADVAVFSRSDGSVASWDLRTKSVRWTASPNGAVSLVRVSQDGTAVVVASGSSVTVFDGATGAPRGSGWLGSGAEAAREIPGGNAVLVVGSTTWTEHKPSTPVLRVALADGATARADVPNCSAPIEVLPDASRAFLSPTFCEEGVQSTANAGSWTNPDPVSVIDLDPNGLHFVKNLPGFGPVALRSDGSLAVAYLDMKRIDRSMFENPAQIPSSSSPEYHLMQIDPKSLAFTLTPIGDALPRFAMTRDGRGLLVDASIKVTTRAKASANASVTVGPNGIAGEVSASASVFDDPSPFGYFDLGARTFTPFAGVQAGIDRFVQLADGKTVIALEKRKDGLGGVPHRIDLQTKTVTAIAEPSGSSGVRDVGLLPDGKTLLVRVRMPAANVGGKLYSQEASYLSLDFSTQLDGSFVLYTDPSSFASADPEGSCPGGHDCW
jgi:WD40 repeat protein